MQGCVGEEDCPFPPFLFSERNCKVFFITESEASAAIPSAFQRLEFNFLKEKKVTNPSQ